VYAVRKIGRKTLYLHRELLNAPDDKIVDHESRNTQDCRRNNLRLMDPSGNSRNKSKIGLSPYVGVFQIGNSLCRSHFAQGVSFALPNGLQILASKRCRCLSRMIVVFKFSALPVLVLGLLQNTGTKGK
jgi:hypothetical protein